MSSNPRERTEIRMLPCQLTEHERAERGRDLAVACNRRDELEETKKEMAADYGRQIKTAEDEVGRLARIVRSGTEEREVECRIQYDVDTSHRTVYRTDTGEVVDDRSVKPAEVARERQAEMFDREDGEVEAAEAEPVESDVIDVQALPAGDPQPPQKLVVEVDATLLDPDLPLSKAYSADTIDVNPATTDGQPPKPSKIRKPFEWQGDLFCTIVTSSRGTPKWRSVEAYRLVKPDDYHGPTGRRSDWSYHGVYVTYRGVVYIMVGPPLVFVAKGSPTDTAGDFDDEGEAEPQVEAQNTTAADEVGAAGDADSEEAADEPTSTGEAASPNAVDPGNPCLRCEHPRSQHTIQPIDDTRPLCTVIGCGCAGYVDSDPLGVAHYDPAAETGGDHATR